MMFEHKERVENNKERVVRLIHELDRLNYKDRRNLLRNPERLIDMIHILKEFGITDPDEIIRKIVDRNRTKLVKLLRDLDEVRRRLNRLQKIFQGEIEQKINQYPYLLWSKREIEDAITTPDDRIQEKMKMFEELGIEVNRKNWILNLSIETIRNRYSRLKELGLDPEEYKNRIGYTEKRLEFLEHLSLILFPEAANSTEAIQKMKEEFSKTYPDKIILNYNKIIRRLKLLENTRTVDEIREYLKKYPGYLTARVDDPDVYANMCDRKKVKEDTKISKEQQIEERRNRKKRILEKELGTERIPKYLLRIGEQELIERIEFIKKRMGLEPKPSQIFNMGKKRREQIMSDE